MTRIFQWFCMWKMEPMSGFGIPLVFTLLPMETVHCSPKNAYTSEISLDYNSLPGSKVPTTFSWRIVYAAFIVYISMACKKYKMVYVTNRVSHIIQDRGITFKLRFAVSCMVRTLAWGGLDPFSHNVRHKKQC